jgi:MFS transporter, DHA1 family, inner membrane transport protein
MPLKSTKTTKLVQLTAAVLVSAAAIFALPSSAVATEPQTALSYVKSPTQFIEAHGIRFAYRKVGGATRGLFRCWRPRRFLHRGPGHSGKAFAIVMAGLAIATIFGSPLATFLGQNLGWRETYIAVACFAGFAFLSISLWVPRTEALNGSPVMQELIALRKPSVWGVILVASVGVASIFAVYTFIGPFVTDAARLNPGMIPIALALFGLGMTAGTLLGGGIADNDPVQGVVIGFGCALLVLAVLAIGGANVWILLPAMFGVGVTMMTAIPTIQVRLTRFAPEAPSLMGAMNLAALNVANAIGAWAGGLAIGAGLGLLSAVWAGFSLTLAGLIIYGLTLLTGKRLAPA